MNLSEKGLFQLASHEGIVVNPYYDSVGVITFGIGHTAGAGNPHPTSIPYMNEPDADRYRLVFDVFKTDIKKFEKRVLNAVKVPLSQHEFDALVSFDFNTGGINTANLTKRLNEGNREAAADGFMGWLRPAEIKGRRTDEMNLFRTGEYNLNGKIAVYRSSPPPAYKLGKPFKTMTYTEFMSYMSHTSDDKPAPINVADYPLLKLGSTGEYVKLLQEILSTQYPAIGKADGIFGPKTDKAVREFQKNNKLSVDSKVGKQTWSFIFGL